MNTSRKLLTLIALVAFVVIVFVIGNNQYPYDAMQVEWGRGRVWGLTHLGTALITLAVAYIGIFVVLTDDRFLEGALTSLRRRRRIIKRVVIGLIVIVALSGLAALSNWIVHDLNDKAERVAWDAQRRAARQRWEQMSPQERGSAKLVVRIGAIPDDPQERVKLDELRDFVPEVYEAETDGEARIAGHANPPDIYSTE